MFLGSFVEEIISPIPSFVVLVPAGAAAQLEHTGWWYLLPLSLFCAAGRLIASSILYVIADKAEDWLFGKGRRFFGVTHKKLENYGQRLNGTSRDYAALFLLNALPVIPTSLLSLSCGFIKVPFRLFAITTFLGSAVNGVFYMSIGYAGLQIASGVQNVQSVLQLAALLLGIFAVGWFVRRRYRKKKGSR